MSLLSKYLTLLFSLSAVIFYGLVFWVPQIDFQGPDEFLATQGAVISSALQKEQETKAPASIERIFYMSQLRRKEGIESLKKNANKIDIIAPQFYELTEKMQLTGGLDKELKEVIEHLTAQAGNNLKVMPLVANSGFKQDIMHKLLMSGKDQQVIIDGLIYLAKENNYIGWQFDFENISYLDKDLYSSFVEKTALAFHEEKLILSVAAVSRSANYEDSSFYKNWSGVFDYARLAKAVDFISLMTYDDPNSVGPVASLPFINDVLGYVKDKIPPEKLSLGIPLYYWAWQVEINKKITTNGTYQRLLNIKNNFEHTLGYDNVFGTAWLSYFWQNEQYKLWFQDDKSFENKLDIIRRDNLRGFSAWVLGVEDPAIWDTLK